MGKATCEQTLDLNVNRLLRYGAFTAGAAFALTWAFDGVPGGMVGIRNVAPSAIRLTYITSGKTMSYIVQIAFTPCFYGGQRPWFLCPICHQRAGVLLLTSKVFVCRKCGNYCYQTQMEQPHGRSIIRTQRLLHKVGGHAPLDEPPKPKGMHWNTYYKIMTRVEEAYGRALRENRAFHFDPQCDEDSFQIE